jgi:two-component system response regulator GlrR
MSCITIENSLFRDRHKANRGSLFLDETATMPAQVQVKLLRFLDRMEIRPVDSTTEIQLDIQLISDIARDLGISRNTVYKKLNEARKVR